MIGSYFKNKNNTDETDWHLALIVGGFIGMFIGYYSFLEGVDIFFITFGGFVIFMLLRLSPSILKTGKILIVGSYMSYITVISLFHISKINPFGWWTLVAIILFGEILFFLDRSKKPKDITRFVFTTIRKIESTSESAIIILSILGITYTVDKIQWIKGVQTILQGISNFGTAYGVGIVRVLWCILFIVAIFIVIIVWIWINSFRYKEKKKKDKVIK